MNRRELMQTVAAAVTGAGVEPNLHTIEAEPLPLLLVLKVPKKTPEYVLKNIRDAFNRIFNGKLPCPFLVLDEGMEITAITDPRNAKRYV